MPAKADHITGDAEKCLSSQGEHWLQLFEQVRWGIAVCRLNDLVITDASATFADMHGYNVRELHHQSFATLLASEGAPDISLPANNAPAANRHSQEAWHRRKDGSRFPVQVEWAIRHDDNGKPCCYWVTVHDISERKQAEQLLLESRALLRAMLAHREVELEQERKRIAREVHDELGQLLSTLRLKIMMQRKFYALAPTLAPHSEDMLSLVDESIRTVRRVATSLRPAVLDLGLNAAMEWLGENFSQNTKIECTITISQLPAALSDEIATCLFRIAQESLTNVLRHANASRAHIAIDADADHIRMRVSDNGRGLCHATGGRDNEITDSESNGIRGMQERAGIFGGELQVRGDGEQGTTVFVTLPLVCEECSV